MLFKYDTASEDIQNSEPIIILLAFSDRAHQLGGNGLNIYSYGRDVPNAVDHQKGKEKPRTYTVHNSKSRSLKFVIVKILLNKYFC
ncbi:MAG: hypothetical protein CH6_0801 [Candidatus Kapaibacterium sp.]|nr:MAG: hypothetical protein CH6_0801 [Candidatus Kapabacteria bacterium]